MWAGEQEGRPLEHKEGRIGGAVEACEHFRR